MTTHYQAIEEAYFKDGYTPTMIQAVALDETVFDRCAAIVQEAYSESEDAQIMSVHCGFGANDLTRFFRDALKGKRGLTVTKIEAYKDPNPKCVFNTKFRVVVEGDGWQMTAFVLAEFEFGEMEDDEGTRIVDTFDNVVIRTAFHADDEAAYGKMLRWWKTVDVSKKLLAA